MQSYKSASAAASSPESTSRSHPGYHAPATESTPLLGTGRHNMTDLYSQPYTAQIRVESASNISPVERGADIRLTSKTGFLAGQSSSLGAELQRIADACGHESTRRDISSVADELQILSTVLWTVQESMAGEREKFNLAFNEDLTQIITELEYCYEEITECCVSLHNTDNPVATVPWFFKKGRVHRLTKHLEAIKATLITMRYVLWHSRDAARGDDGHVMANNRYIIESIFERNRNAILNVEALKKIDAELEKENLAVKQDQDVDYFNVKNDYNTFKHRHEITEQDLNISGTQGLTRRFTKRVPLKVHTSIAGMTSSEMSSRLFNKWGYDIHRGTDDQQIRSNLANVQSMQDSPFNSGANLQSSTGTHNYTAEEDADLEANNADLSKSKKRRNILLSSPLGVKMRKAIGKLSLSKSNSAEDEQAVKVKRSAHKHGVIVYPRHHEIHHDDSPLHPCPPDCNHTGRSQREHTSKGRFTKFLEFFLGEMPSKSPLQTPDFYDTQGSQQSGR